ncbi:MAG: hypothetical protein ACON31_12220 [Candidatus Puniceispirillaceae bacterium]
MTLILETPESDIHQCPGCGAPCAVERERIRAASNAGQRVSIACHKCDAIFRPDNDTRIADDVRGAPPGRSQPNRRIGSCNACGNSFSLHPLDAGDAVLIECPHCAHRMFPDEVASLDARREIMAKAVAQLPPARPRRRWMRGLIATCLGGVLLAGVAGATLEGFTPDLPKLPFATAPSVPRIAVTDTAVRTVTGDDRSVLVSVTLANLGTAEGAPEKVVVRLVDAEGDTLLRRPIAAREMTLQPGASRTLVSRMSASAPVADLFVELTRRPAGD